MIQTAFNTVIYMLLARFILNDMPHAAGLFQGGPKSSPCAIPFPSPRIVQMTEDKIRLRLAKVLSHSVRLREQLTEEKEPSPLLPVLPGISEEQQRKINSELEYGAEAFSINILKRYVVDDLCVLEMHAYNGGYTQLLEKIREARVYVLDSIYLASIGAGVGRRRANLAFIRKVKSGEYKLGVIPA